MGVLRPVPIAFALDIPLNVKRLERRRRTAHARHPSDTENEAENDRRHHAVDGVGVALEQLDLPAVQPSAGRAAA